jgi:hypothetical protein
VRFWSQPAGSLRVSAFAEEPAEIEPPAFATVGYATLGGTRHPTSVFAIYEPARLDDVPTLREYPSDPHVEGLVINFPEAAPVAQAGAGPDGAPGGYEPGLDRFFFISTTSAGQRLVVMRRSSVQAIVIPDLDAVLAAQTLLPFARCGRATINGPGPNRYTGLAHDPASQRIAIQDPCNGVVWVLGYDEAGGAITVRDVLRPPMATGAFAYDPSRHVLWSGDHRVHVDLAAP